MRTRCDALAAEMSVLQQLLAGIGSQRDAYTSHTRVASAIPADSPPGRRTLHRLLHSSRAGSVIIDHDMIEIERDAIGSPANE